MTSNTQLADELAALAGKAPPFPWEATERHGYIEIIAPRDRADWYGRKGVWAALYCDTDRDESEQGAIADLVTKLFNNIPTILTALRNPAPLPAEVGVVDIIMRAGKCGQHHVGGCQSCEAALAYNNDLLDQLRTQLAAAQAKAQEMAGEIEGLREIVVELWHGSTSDRSLRECLNMTEAEYTAWANPHTLTLKDKDNGK